MHMAAVCRLVAGALMMFIHVLGKVTDHLRPHQRDDAKLVRIPRTEDYQYKNTGETGFRKTPIFLPHMSTFSFQSY